MAENTGVLSVDQAVTALNERPKEQEAPEVATASEPLEQQEANQAEAEENTEATTSEAASEAEQPGDGETQEAQAEPEGIKLEPPKWWNKAAKDRFRDLPPELQAVVFEQEETRERVVAKSKQEAAEARKAAEEASAKVTERLSHLDQLVPQAVKTFQSRWANVDWQQLAVSVEPVEYNRIRAQFEAEQQTLASLAQEHERAEQERFTKFVQEETAKLAEIAPELVDEAKGAERKQELGKFLLGLGFPAKAITAMSAQEAALAYDAMRWRNAQKAAATKLSQPVKPAPVQKPQVRPSASNSARSPNASRLASLAQKSSWSIDEAVEALNLKG